MAVGSIGELGASTGLDGDQSDASVDRAGVYLFARAGSVWSQRAYVKASNTRAESTVGLQFGFSTALSGNTWSSAQPFESSSATGVNWDQASTAALGAGAVYVFR